MNMIPGVGGVGQLGGFNQSKFVFAIVLFRQEGRNTNKIVNHY